MAQHALRRSPHAPQRRFCLCRGNDHATAQERGKKRAKAVVETLATILATFSITTLIVAPISYHHGLKESK